MIQNPSVGGEGVDVELVWFRGRYHIPQGRFSVKCIFTTKTDGDISYGEESHLGGLHSVPAVKDSIAYCEVISEYSSVLKDMKGGTVVRAGEYQAADGTNMTFILCRVTG